MNQKKTFGSTLGSLNLADLGMGGPADLGAKTAAEAPFKLKVRMDLIDRDPDQPRKKIDPKKLAELAQTMDIEGQLQPITIRVNPSKPGRFFVFVGERRWRAAGLNNWEEIDAIVKDAPSSDRLVAQVVENLQREELSPMDTADALQRLNEQGMKAGEIARRLGKSAAYVSDYLSLKSAHPDLREAMEDDRIKSIHVLAEAVRLMKNYPDAVLAAVALSTAEEPFSLAAIRAVKAVATGKGPALIFSGSDASAPGASGAVSASTSPGTNIEAAVDPKDEGSSQSPGATSKTTAPVNPVPRATPHVRPTPTQVTVFVADVDGQPIGTLCLDQASAKEGFAKVRDGSGAATMEISLADLRIDRVTLE